MPIIRLDPDSPRGKKLQNLQTLYYSLIAIPLLAFMIFYLQSIQPDNQPYLQQKDILSLHLIVWLITLGGAMYLLWWYRKRIGNYGGAGSLEDKFGSYIARSRGLYFRLVPLMLLPIAAIWATGVPFYGALFSLMIILVASVRPTVEQFIQRYNLSKEEQAAVVEQT